MTEASDLVLLVEDPLHLLPVALSAADAVFPCCSTPSILVLLSSSFVPQPANDVEVAVMGLEFPASKPVVGGSVLVENTEMLVGNGGAAATELGREVEADAVDDAMLPVLLFVFS